MVQLNFKARREQQLLLAACASSRPAPAAHLSRRQQRDRVVGFADVAALPDPDWAVEAPGRYTVDGLLPGGRVASVPLPVEPEPLLAELLAETAHVVRSRDAAFEAVMKERCEASAEYCHTLAADAWIDDAIGEHLRENAAAVLDAVAARPELRHNHALLMALAPVVATLKGSVA